MGLFDLLLVVFALFLVSIFHGQFELGYWLSVFIAMFFYGLIQRLIQGTFKWVQQQKRPTLRIFAPFFKGDETL